MTCSAGFSAFQSWAANRHAGARKSFVNLSAALCGESSAASANSYEALRMESAMPGPATMRLFILLSLPAHNLRSFIKTYNPLFRK